jgi:hypothetical protein
MRHTNFGGRGDVRQRDTAALARETQFRAECLTLVAVRLSCYGSARAVEVRGLRHEDEMRRRLCAWGRSCSGDGERRAARRYGWHG